MTQIDFGSKLITILSFLFIFWALSNFLINKYKSGEWKIPKFLKNYLSIHNKNFADKEYDVNLIQREILADGSELLIIGVDGRRILLSKSMHAGLRYLTELDEKE